MSQAGERMLEGAREAVAIAKGEQPAASIWIKGHRYVPEVRWQSVEAAPECDPFETRPEPVLIYSPRFGIRTGTVFRFLDRLNGSVSNLHGNVVEDWGATHWMPLPPPPQGA